MADKLEQVKKIAKESYSKKDYIYHILPTLKYALLLAKKLNADAEVVEVSVYFHDIGRAMRRRGFEEKGQHFFDNNDHHIVGAEETKGILSKLEYGEEFIKKVEHCVLTHRGRKGPNPESLEAEIIACADAMSHFDTFLDLFSFFLETTNSFEEAIIKIEQKMDRNWNKKLTLPEAKEMVKGNYESIMLLIKSMKQYIK